MLRELGNQVNVSPWEGVACRYQVSYQWKEDDIISTNLAEKVLAVIMNDYDIDNIKKKSKLDICIRIFFAWGSQG